MVKQHQFNLDLLNFLNHSPTPFHAVREMVKQFEQAGFSNLGEQQSPVFHPGAGYYYYAGGHSSLVVWRMGEDTIAENGIRLMCAHTDSPCLKVKPSSVLHRHHAYQLGVEVYGGALLSPWFDRDLTLAGRLVFKDSRGTLKMALVNFKRAIAHIPSLAIHLNRGVNLKHSINSQKDLPLVLSVGAKLDFMQLLQQQLLAEYPNSDCHQILDYELSAVDTQPAAITGIQNEFISGARLDNLLSCYIGMRALIDTDSKQTSLLVCNDHEEVGSGSYMGAQGTLLKEALEWLLPDPVSRQQACRHSLLISADNTHGIHPNFPQASEPDHSPILNAGPALKVNSAQKYATNSLGAGWVRLFAERAGVPLQQFISRSDTVCGSTIGSITASQIGVNTVDIGVPQWAMHSIRETAGNSDSYALYKLIRQHYSHRGSLAIDSINPD